METFSQPKSNPIFSYIIPIIGIFVLAASGMLTYSKYKELTTPTLQPDSSVLGEKAPEVEKTVCNSSETLESELLNKNVIIPLNAPDKQKNFVVADIASCITFPSCSDGDLTCNVVTASVDKVCLSDYFESNPLDLNDYVEIIGNKVSISVRKQDWVLVEQTFVDQLAKSLEKELSYCDLSGELPIGKSKLSPITVPVADTVPSASKTFATRFLEIDNTKEKAYYWEAGVYQELRMKKGADAGKNRVVTLSNFSLSKYFSSHELEFLNKELTRVDYIVVHQ